jgi:selenocysteine lyase/cysteine desulfurase
MVGIPSDGGDVYCLCCGQVDALRKQHRIEVDSRKTYVRIGFGFNHHSEDVDRLLQAVGSGL